MNLYSSENDRLCSVLTNRYTSECEESYLIDICVNDDIVLVNAHPFLFLKDLFFLNTVEKYSFSKCFIF